ncbi:hypothetical protein HK101_003260 [Irineochytrium annulatum]|nr:hypothetical protein HK101_003260 [Irineochytrium annulatum]
MLTWWPVGNNSALSEENLKRHTEASRSSVALGDRICEWRRAIPAEVDEELLKTPMQADGPDPIGSRRPLSGPHHQGSHSGGSRHGAIGSGRPHLGSGSAGRSGRASLPQQQSLNRSLPTLGRSGDHDRGGYSQGGHAKHDAARGRLLCCLKVEIKTGVYRMLPVHDNDNPNDLSHEFCRANNLMSSSESLTNHIVMSMKTFGAQTAAQGY